MLTPEVITVANRLWLRDQLKAYDPRLLASPAGRRALTRLDFRLFCLLYFRALLKGDDTGGFYTLNEFHEAFMADALKYAVPAPGPSSSRTAWVCPRGAGKTTMMAMLMLWLAAHNHQKYILVFSGTADQADDIFGRVRGQLHSNPLLQEDYPTLCEARTRASSKRAVSEARRHMVQKNGVTFKCRSMEASVMGTGDEDNVRPTLMLLDDIEGGEGVYSQAAALKRLDVLQSDIFPLSLNAHVVWIGTTTRPLGLTEALVHAAINPATLEEHEAWVRQENFTCNYWPVLLDEGQPTERSLWPERGWTLSWIAERRHQRSFMKAYMCLPAPEDYEYWAPEDFTYLADPDEWTCSSRIISIDPAVGSTRGAHTDATGIAVVSISRAEKACCVDHVEGVALKGEDLRRHVLRLLEVWPDVEYITWESNQGGPALAYSTLHHMPVDVKPRAVSGKKEARAEQLLTWYRRGWVRHRIKFPAYEAQAMAFPRGQHDDLIDAVGNGVRTWLDTSKRKKPLSATTL